MGTNTKDTNLANNKRILFDNLKKQEADAIRHLGQRVGAFLPTLSGYARLPLEDREELVSDAVIVTVGNIGKGKFTFEDTDPVTYAIAVAKNLLFNRLRKKKLDTVSIENVTHLPGFDPEANDQKKEQQLIIGAMLDKLEDPCRQLIRWRYYDNLKDEEIMERKLSHFTTLNSLKSQRCKCLKKLSDMAREYRHLLEG